MESEQLQNFNERLNQWVANQGFWFQVRYSMGGKGAKGQAMFHLLRMGFRLLIFLLVVAVGCWVYLMKRPDTKQFRAGLQRGFKAGLSADEFEASRIQAGRGRLEIGRIGAVGGNDTFFSSLQARNLRCKLGLTDGLLGVWDAGVITMARLEVDLRAGAVDDESAAKIGEVLFRRSDKVEFGFVEVADATIRWGYSGPTRGAIEGSALSMQRIPTGWRLAFQGGSFRQNWLRRLEIVELVAVCGPSGISFEKAEFKSGDARIVMSGLHVSGGAIPEIGGVAKIKNVPLNKILPSAVTDFIEGSISGELQVSGSTNTSDGVGFEGRIQLGEDDTITLRERIHILKALSVVDGIRNYKRVDYTDGSFRMKTSGGELLVTDVDLRSEDLFTLEGAFKVRPPTGEEQSEAMSRTSSIGDWTGMEDDPDPFDSLGRRGFSLRRAALAAADDENSPGGASLFDKIDSALEARRLSAQAAERLSRMLRYEGKLRISIPGDAFEGAGTLQRLHQPDPATGRILLPVPLDGFLYELTLDQAEEMYRLGQR